MGFNRAFTMRHSIFNVMMAPIDFNIQICLRISQKSTKKNYAFNELIYDHYLIVHDINYRYMIKNQ